MDHSQSPQIEQRFLRELRLLVFSIALALLQVTFVPQIVPFAPSVPFITWICLAFAAQELPVHWDDLSLMTRSALYSGLTLDLLTMTTLGTHALALIGALCSIILIVRRLHLEGIGGALIAAALGIVLHEAILWGLLGGSPGSIAFISNVALPAMLITLFPVIPAYFIARWWAQRLTRRVVPIEIE